MMSTEPVADATFVRKSVTVRVPVAHAFEVFTTRFDLWWPRSHHIGKAEIERAVLEGKQGGRWYERSVDGSECDWGRVLEWDPPRRVVLSWHIMVTWGYDPDPAHASRLEVTFHEEGPGVTRVELVHSELDRHGAGWQKMRESIAGDGGWTGILQGFAAKAAETLRA